ncbi:MAG: hypothetical protein AAGC43_07870 [Bacteroidota bacterium]
MKNQIIKFSALVFVIFLNACETEKSETKENNSSVEENLYFGQKPPGLIPEIFDFEILSTEDWNLGGKFNSDIKEFYLTNSRGGLFEPTVIVFRKENNVWEKHNFHSSLSGDSNILYDEAKYIEKTNYGWSKIKSLGPMFEREDWGIMRLSASANGTFVFDDWKSNDVIRISRIKDGKREEPKLLGKEINTGKWTAHPFIAPNESYLIWDSEREGGYGGADIYISFRQKDGSWGTAINLGDKINTTLWENAAMVTPDGKYLGFSRSEEKVRKDGSTYWESNKYWVDTKIIENLRPKQ